MTSDADVNVELAKVQKEIKSHLGLSSENLIFDYKNQEGNSTLNLITINPRHNQSFLFHKTSGVDRLDAVKKMWEYVKIHKANTNSYTIQWIAEGEKELHTSYFKARNMYEALDKLYFGRDMQTISIFSIVLNPVS